MQLPPRGVWGQGGLARCQTLDTWTGKPMSTDTTPDELVVRYLAAFGPATGGDGTRRRGRGSRAWVTPWGTACARACAASVTSATASCWTYAAHRSPTPPHPAPPRFLPEFDNVIVAYADRSRVIPPDHHKTVIDGLGRPMLLVDGTVRGFWKVEASQGHRDA